MIILVGEVFLGRLHMCVGFFFFVSLFFILSIDRVHENIKITAYELSA